MTSVTSEDAPEYVRPAHAGPEERGFDLGPIEVAVGLGDPPKALAPRADVSLQDHGVGTHGDNPHEQRHDGELVVSDPIIGPRASVSHRFTDGLEELKVETGLRADLPIGRRRQPTEAVPIRRVEERE